MIKGDVYEALLEPTRGAEQAGTRHVIIVSRDAINAHSPVVIIVPVTRRANRARLLPSHVEIKMGEGGLTGDAVALCEQVRAVSTSRLANRLGHLSGDTISHLDVALKIALDLS